MKNFHLYLIVSTFILASCGGGGGGGGGSTPTTPTTPAPTVNLSADPTSVLLESTSTLTWSSTNATSCSASWTSQTGTSGSEAVTITSAGSNSFSITCSGAGGSGSASVTVEGYRETDGVVVDGYISGAEVCIDEDESWTCDSNENTTTSDNEGKFTIKYANGNLVSIGGTDLDSQTLLDNLLITHKLTGHSDFKAVTPVTSIAAFMEDASLVNAALGIDSSIDIFTFDPVANKGDGGIYDYLYEKGNQLTVLAFALQNITNNLNTTTETTQDYFKAITEEIEKEYTETETKVDIETEAFVTKALDNVITAKSATIDETAKTNAAKALAGVMPVIAVKSSDDLTTSVIRFAVSTLQTDIQAIANGTATAETVTSYTSDILTYIAEDQNIDSNEITPDISAIADNITTSEDTAVEINILLNDSYVTTAPVTVTASNGTNGTTTITDSSPEQITYDPDPDYNGTDTFSYTITQGDKTSSADVTVIIEPVNDKPSIDVASTIKVDENQTAVTTVSVSDVDEDELTLTLGGTDADSFNLSGENVLTFKEAPDYETKTSYSISLNLTDGELADNKTIDILVNDVQEVFILNDNFTNDEDAISLIDVLANDSYVGSTFNLSVEDAINGELTVVSSEGKTKLNFVPNLNWYGSEELTYNLTAGNETRSGKVQLEYLPVNDPPEIKVIKNIEVTVDSSDIDNGSNVFVITNDKNKSIFFNSGITYAITHPENHPLKFSSTEDGIHNNGISYDTGVDTSQAGLTLITITDSTPDNLFYYCESHSGMGGSFTRSTKPFRINENLSGQILEIQATDVDSPVLTYSIKGDDSSAFTIGDENKIISMINKQDYENPADKNLDNILNILYQVSDGFLNVNYEINLMIEDVNYPASLIHTFESRCDDDLEFGYQSAIDEKGSVVILSGKRGCSNNSDERIFAYQKINDSWNEMETKQYLPNYQGPTTNPIMAGDALFLNDNGNRFSKSINNKRSILIPYDYTSKYENTNNWNETFEMGGEDSSISVSGSSEMNGGGSKMSNTGRFMTVWRNAGRNENGQPTRSDIKIYDLSTTSNENGDYRLQGPIFEAEYDENRLGQNSISDVDISDDGLTLAIAFNNKPAGGSGSGFIKTYKWDGVFKGSQDNFIEDQAVINFCSEDSSIEVYGLWKIYLNSDGTSILIDLRGGGVNRNAFCIKELKNGEWNQKGQIINGSELNNQTDAPKISVYGFSSDGERVLLKYNTSTSSTISSDDYHVAIYDWSPFENIWKQSGTNIPPIDGNEIYGKSVLSSDGSKLLLPSSTISADSDGNKKGSLQLYFLPEN